ncbi:hypothetical protein HanPI659440_Chr01g0014421 [Helianthus annuus]|nr:hypothetical protein HanPI659440_Chr01g0014421 [Helianthus annuus]
MACKVTALTSFPLPLKTVTRSATRVGGTPGKKVIRWWEKMMRAILVKKKVIHAVFVGNKKVTRSILARKKSDTHRIGREKSDTPVDKKLCALYWWKKKLCVPYWCQKGDTWWIRPYYMCRITTSSTPVQWIMMRKNNS